jgi:hypothetical protein
MKNVLQGNKNTPIIEKHGQSVFPVMGVLVSFDG